MAPLSIIVIGAGIGGPAAAIGLAQSEHKVTIYERCASTDSIGYAFRITENSDRCLKHLGIDAQAGGAVSANTTRMFDQEGKVIMEIKENQKGGSAGVSVFASRPQLNAQLMRKAVEIGVEIKLGVKVVSVDTEKTEIVLEDGTRVGADLVVAADGVQSVARSVVLQSHEDVPKASTGHNALRFMIDIDKLWNEPGLSSVMSKDFRMFSWFSKEKAILAYPVDFEKKYNIVCTHPEHLSDQAVSEGADATAAAYDQKISQEEMLDIYSDFEPTVLSLLKLADPDGLRVWKLRDMDDTSTWSRNRTVLLGDACHPVLPFGFSGASMSIEDALTLSILLSTDIEVDHIPDRLKLYEVTRRPRLGKVRDMSRKIGRWEADNAAIREYREFLSSYNAVEHAERVLSNLTTSEIPE